MKEAKFLKVDYTIQLIFGLIVLITTPFVYGIILLLPFGIWQVISSLTMVYAFRNQKRVAHLVFTVTWFCIYLIFQDANIEFPLAFSYVIVLPACVGFWYFLQTKRDYKKTAAIVKKENEYV